jgi:hypothetical protein
VLTKHVIFGMLAALYASSTVKVQQVLTLIQTGTHWLAGADPLILLVA